MANIKTKTHDETSVLGVFRNSESQAHLQLTADTKQEDRIYTSQLWLTHKINDKNTLFSDVNWNVSSGQLKYAVATEHQVDQNTKWRLRFDQSNNVTVAVARNFANLVNLSACTKVSRQTDNRLRFVFGCQAELTE